MAVSRQYPNVNSDGDRCVIEFAPGESVCLADYSVKIRAQHFGEGQIAEVVITGVVIKDDSP